METKYIRRLSITLKEEAYWKAVKESFLERTKNLEWTDFKNDTSRFISFDGDMMLVDERVEAIEDFVDKYNEETTNFFDHGFNWRELDEKNVDDDGFLDFDIEEGEYSTSLQYIRKLFKVKLIKEDVKVSVKADQTIEVIE